MTSIIFYTRRTKTQENVSFVYDHYVSADVHFLHFEGTEMHVFSHRSTSYVLKSFVCLEVCNRVLTWNVAKKLIFVQSILQICQLEILLFIYKLRCQTSLWTSVSYGFCEFNRVAIWNKGKAIILVRSSFQICQLEILVSYSTWTFV